MPMLGENVLQVLRDRLPSFFGGPTYRISSVDDIANGSNPLGLRVHPLRRESSRYKEHAEIVGGYITARHKKSTQEILNCESLPQVIRDIKEEVMAPYGTFSGVIIHTDDLTQKQADTLAGALGIPEVVYVRGEHPKRRVS